MSVGRGGAGLGCASVGGWGGGGEHGAVSGRSLPWPGPLWDCECPGLGDARVPFGVLWEGGRCGARPSARAGAVWGGVLLLRMAAPAAPRCRRAGLGPGAVCRRWALGGSAWSGAVVSSILAESLRSEGEISYRALLWDGKRLFLAPPAGLDVKRGLLSPSCSLVPVSALLAAQDALCS